MKTFSHGDYTTKAPSIEEGLAITEQQALFNYRETERKVLRALKHYHIFGNNRACACGVTQLEYDAAPPGQDQYICVKATDPCFPLRPASP